MYGHDVAIFTRIWTRCGRCIVLGQVVFWVEHPVQRRICPIFVKSQVLEKGDLMEWCRVTRHPQIFRRLTVVNETPGNGASHYNL